MTLKPQNIKPMPKEKDSNTWCAHPNATVNYEEPSEGRGLNGRYVFVIWEYIFCPDCRTEKRLKK